MSDLIDRQAAIDALKKAYWDKNIQSAKDDPCIVDAMTDWAIRQIKALPSTQLGQRYTNEELEIFQHGISLSLLSKRSAQHWRYDENTATEIKFLERLYEKVSANMRGGHFFCTHIGKGIYADYPVKYCKVAGKYFTPFVVENGEKRKLDFGNIKDCKMWHGTGCNMHPSTVEKAKREFLDSLEKAVMEGEVTE